MARVPKASPARMLRRVGAAVGAAVGAGFFRVDGSHLRTPARVWLDCLVEGL